MPRIGGERGLGQEGADHVVYGANFSLGFAILRGGVWARETKLHAIVMTKVEKILVCIFFTIITLKLFNFTFELSVNEIVKLCKYIKYLGFI